MDTTTKKLKQYNIVRRKVKTCQCSNQSLVYMIPVRLCENIIRFLEPFGKPAFNFKKASVLKIENTKYSITGVRRLKEIRVSIKKDAGVFLDLFEDALINYIKSIK